MLSDWYDITFNMCCVEKINDLSFFLSFLNVPTIRYKQKNLEIQIRIRNPLYGSKDPDPSQNVTVPEYPEHWYLMMYNYSELAASFRVRICIPLL